MSERRGHRERKGKGDYQFRKRLVPSSIAYPPLEQVISATFAASGTVSPAFSNYAAESLQFFARLATQPTTARKNAYNTLFTSLLVSGVLQKLDALYIYAAADSATALTNLVQSSYACTAVNSPVFSTGHGFAQNGTGYLDTNFNPTTAVSPNYVRNDACIFAYGTPSGYGGSNFAGDIFGSASDSNVALLPRFNGGGGNTFYMALNASSGGYGQLDNSFKGLFAGDRTASNVQTLYKDGVAGTPSAIVSSAVPNSNFTILSGNSEGLYHGGAVHAAGFGKSLGDAGHAALSEALDAYLEAVVPSGLIYFYDVSTLPTCTQIDLYTTTDGLNMTPYGSNPVATMTGPGGVGTTTNTQTCDVMYYGGLYWMTVCQNVNPQGATANQTTVGIQKSSSPTGPFVWQNDITIFPSLTQPSLIDNAHWFIDDDGTVRLIVSASQGGTWFGNCHGYIFTCNNPGTFTSWDSGVLITGSGVPSNWYDMYMVPPGKSPNGKYSIIYTDMTFDNTDRRLGLIESTSLTSGYTVTKGGLGLVNGNFVFGDADTTQAEGPIMKNMGPFWRLYLSEIGVPTTYFVDSYDDWLTWSSPQQIIGDPIAFSTSGWPSEPWATPA